LRRILIGLAALGILGIGLVFIAPRFISTDEMWSKALAQVESTTGYRVRVDGPVRVTFFPSLDLVASDVGIAQPVEGGAAEFATARSVKFGLMLGGLLSGKVQFTEMMLVDPVITLPLPKRAGPEPAADGASEPEGTMQQLTLDELHIQNGTVVLPAADGAPGIEEAKKGLDEEKAVAFAKKLKSGKGFDLTDFKEQMAQMRNMGGLSALMDKMPAQIAQAAGQMPAGAENKMIGRVEGIINSMTPAERAKPELIKASRKRRIALGAGVQVQDVNRLLNQFEQTQKMMKQFSKGGIGKLMRGMKGMLPGMGGMGR
jgi:hypothetical protein